MLLVTRYLLGEKRTFNNVCLQHFIQHSYYKTIRKHYLGGAKRN